MGLTLHLSPTPVFSVLCDVVSGHGRESVPALAHRISIPKMQEAEADYDRQNRGGHVEDEQIDDNDDDDAQEDSYKHLQRPLVEMRAQEEARHRDDMALLGMVVACVCGLSRCRTSTDI